MELAVITPVGPGHIEVVQNCIRSVGEMERGPFSNIRHVVVEDYSGALGRSRARNKGMVDADWYFFLDADDTIYPDATAHLDTRYVATFGLIVLNGRAARSNICPCKRVHLVKHGARGTLSMGMFVRAEVARSLRFNEGMEIGEDFDFYMRLPNFIKVPEKLVNISYPLNKGKKSDWLGACRQVIDSCAPY